MLKRLENNGLVSCYWDDGDSGCGRRRYHRITEEGLMYIERRKEEWIFFRNILDTFFGEV